MLRQLKVEVLPKIGMSVYHNVHEFLHANKTPLMKSSSPNIFYTKLPEHHRSNKSLPSPFTVLITSPVPDGTIVTVAAGNDETPSGEVRHDTAKVIRQVARFSDLRFVGKSGRVADRVDTAMPIYPQAIRPQIHQITSPTATENRIYVDEHWRLSGASKNFHLTICVHTKPMMIAMVARAIKVTVDGPREARTPNAALAHRRRPASFASPVTPFFHIYAPQYPPYSLGRFPTTRHPKALGTPANRSAKNHPGNEHENSPRPLRRHRRRLFGGRVNLINSLSRFRMDSMGERG
ncbi:runt domain protein [Ancylostoma ceylanicum]|uniref:Runt domain protein n=1 Tax=Ancylostoma ceylanicum TaxID=53326 RepID=A0A0D6LPY4_9BILA|nr:runt domain protein [Ancylostoma ceylanicum]